MNSEAKPTGAIESPDSLLLILHHEKRKNKEHQNRESDERYEPENQGVSPPKACGWADTQTIGEPGFNLYPQKTLVSLQASE